MINAFFELLRSNGCIVVNKNLSKNIGLNEAIIYSELVSRFLYFKEKNQLTDDGFFFNTVEDLEDGTTLNDYMQRKSINNLKELGLIETSLKNIPPKRYFKIIENTELLNSLITKKSNQEALRINSLNFKELNVKNLKTNNTNDNNTKETNISINTNISKNSKTTKNNCIEKTKPLIDTSIDKKKKKAEAVKEIFYMTESFSSNDDVVKTLKEYLKFRLNRGLQINQWKLILDDLKNYTKTDNEKIQKINNAIAGGYMQFIPSWEKDKKIYSKFDNATDSKADSIVGMNKEQKDNFINRLNKDADGKLKGY